MSYLKYSLAIVFFSFIIWTIACSGKPGTLTEKPIQSEGISETTALQKVIEIVSPEEGSTIKAGEIIQIEFSQINTNYVPDSVEVFFNGTKISTLKNREQSFNLEKNNYNKVGRNYIKLIAYRGSQKPQTITRFITVLSDIVPRVQKYKVVNDYPHDRNAYTQGLVFEDDFLFEGTGTYGGSDLRKVELKTGNVIKQQKIENSLFGEGIAILGDRIYQLTWTSNVGFVYEKSTFKLLKKIYYQTEGWGLTVFEDKLVMSDGSNILYFINPESFTVISSIEVFDNEKQVDQLNELEVINGEIWANIYQTDMIARIDPETGKVLGYIDLSGILQDVDRDINSEVLNGIAWDPAGDRIFVTGKHWSKLFEIRIVE